MAKLLLTGSTGYLGHYLMDAARARGFDVVTAGRSGCDLTLDFEDPEAAAATGVAAPPDYVLNSGAMSAMGECQAQPAKAFTHNGKAPPAMAAACGCRFLQVSTDLVFGGADAPYCESDAPEPASVYGRSKAEGERLAGDDWVVVRVPLLFGRSYDGRHGATDMLRGGVGREERLTLFANEYRTPLHVADAAAGLLDLLVDDSVRGIRHLPGPERVSRWEFAQRFCAVAGLPEDAFLPGRSADPSRPKDVSLAGAWRAPRDLDAALADC